MAPHEHLRGKETTPEGRHLEMPDAFPHVMMARLVAVIVAVAIAIGALWMIGGGTVAAVGGVILLVVVFPYLLVRLNRATQRERAVEIEEEHAIEAREAHPPTRA